MAFSKKTWKDRVSQYINRRLLTDSDGNTQQVTVTRDEGSVTEAGDAFSASNMNDLEDRIEDAFDGLTAADIPYVAGVSVADKLDNVPTFDTLTTSDNNKLLGVSVSGSDISVGAVTADNIVNNATVTPLNTYPYSGITNNSTVYRYGHLLIINISVTLSTSINAWVNCFNIGLNANVVSTIGVVSTDTNISTYAQAYFDTDKIVVRISSPQNVQYRGQLIVLIA